MGSHVVYNMGTGTKSSTWSTHAEDGADCVVAANSAHTGIRRSTRSCLSGLKAGPLYKGWGYFCTPMPSRAQCDLIDDNTVLM